MSQARPALARAARALAALATVLLAALPAMADQPAPAERPLAMQHFLDEVADPGGGTAFADLVVPDPPPDLPPDLAAAVDAYRETGEPAVLGTPQARIWPFGHGVPRLTCLPLRACDIALEAGETLLGWALGDSERWRAEELVEGTPPAQRPHLLLKPTDAGLATNLVLVTDRRTYHLELDSPELHATEPTPYDHRVSWWYPDDWVRRREISEIQRADTAARATARRAAAVEIDRPLDPGRLSFAYRLERPFWPKRRLPWEPVTVFDDGERVYLRLPERARRHELPVLLGRLPDGTTYPLAARLQGEWLVVPTLFERADLVLGSGDRRRSLTLLAQIREEGTR